MPKEVIVSTYIAPLTRLGSPELVLDSLKEAGFSYYDFSMMFPILGFDLIYDSEKHIERASSFRKYADSLNMYCNQTHGAVPCFKKDNSEEENKLLFNRLKKTIEVSGILGAKYCVLHPVCDCTMEENINFFNSLTGIAKENNVVIAIENTLSNKLFGKPNDFIELFKHLDDNHFKVCLDIGHSEVNNVGSSAIEFIEKLKDKIVCLHIHDNDKITDSHQLPFSLVIQFEPIFKALKNSGYKGDITFECGSYFDNMPVSLFVDALKFLYKVGVYIGNKVFD